MLPGDPTTTVVAVLCDNFGGSGTLVLTVAKQSESTDPELGQADVVSQLRCTQTQQEDVTTLDLAVGASYLVTAEFTGAGYTDWFLQAGDDD